MSPRQTVSLSQTKINDVNHLCSGVLAHDEVVRLDVTVDEAPLVEVLKASEHLKGDS